MKTGLLYKSYGMERYTLPVRKSVIFAGIIVRYIKKKSKIVIPGVLLLM